MAKKGSYHVHDPEGQPTPQDSSYKSFLCVLLIFISFCVLIIVFSSVNWRKGKEKESVEINKDAESLSDKYQKEKDELKDTKKESEIESLEPTQERDDKEYKMPGKGKEESPPPPPPNVTNRPELETTDKKVIQKEVEQKPLQSVPPKHIQPEVDTTDKPEIKTTKTITTTIGQMKPVVNRTDELEKTKIAERDGADVTEPIKTETITVKAIQPEEKKEPSQDLPSKPMQPMVNTTDEPKTGTKENSTKSTEQDKVDVTKPIKTETTTLKAIQPEEKKEPSQDLPSKPMQPMVNTTDESKIETKENSTKSTEQDKADITKSIKTEITTVKSIQPEEKKEPSQVLPPEQIKPTVDTTDEPETETKESSIGSTEQNKADITETTTVKIIQQEEKKDPTHVLPPKQIQPKVNTTDESEATRTSTKSIEQDKTDVTEPMKMETTTEEAILQEEKEEASQILPPKQIQPMVSTTDDSETETKENSTENAELDKTDVTKPMKTETTTVKAMQQEEKEPSQVLPQKQIQPAVITTDKSATETRETSTESTEQDKTDVTEPMKTKATTVKVLPSKQIQLTDNTAGESEIGTNQSTNGTPTSDLTETTETTTEDSTTVTTKDKVGKDNSSNVLSRLQQFLQTRVQFLETTQVSTVINISESTTEKATTVEGSEVTTLAKIMSSERVTTPKQITTQESSEVVQEAYLGSDEEKDIKNLTSNAIKTTSTTTTIAPVKKNLSLSQRNAEKRSKSKFKMTVSHMLGSMDHTMGACEDFYWYSCGASTEISSPVAKKENDFQQILKREVNNPTNIDFVQKMTVFYKTCVDHESLFNYNDRVNQVEAIIKKFVLTTPSKENFTKLFAEMVLTNSMPIMDVDVDVDSKTNKYVFKLSPPYKSLARGEMERWSALYGIDRSCAKQLLAKQRFDAPKLSLDQIYADYAACKKDFRYFLKTFNVTRKSIEFISKISDINELVEREILGYIKDVETTHVRDNLLLRTYREQTLGDLESAFDAINWKSFFKELSGQDLDDDSKIFVYGNYTLVDILTKLNEVMPDNSYMNFVSIYANDIYQNIVIPKSSEAREQYCSKLVDYLFSDVSSYLYMRNLTEDQMEEAKNVTNRVFETLHAQFLSNVHKSETLQDDEKEDILDRINELKPHFMDNFDECITGDEYQSVTLQLNFADQLVTLRKYKSRQKFSMVGRIVEDNDIFCHFVQPQDVKPKSFYYSPKIAMPYGFLLQWSADYPMYFLMAKVGLNIAMEIGKLFNRVGLDHIFDSHTITEGLDAEIIQDFYNVRNKNLSMTLSEVKNLQTVGDNAGFRLSYDSFNQTQIQNVDLPFINLDFSYQKIFYIAAAQEFCEDPDLFNYMLRLYEGGTYPNYWRLNSMIINSKDFKRAFGCRDGSNMDPGTSTYLAFPDVAEDS